MEEMRRFRRFPLSQNDAVYCIVVKSGSMDKPIAVSTVDFSQSGFRFAVPANMKHHFAKGNNFLLKAITGTRNFTFKEMVELSIKWQYHDLKKNMVNFGCEIFNITTESEQQLLEFIYSELKFKGLRLHNYSQKGSSNPDYIEQKNEYPVKEKKGSMRVVSILGSPRIDGNTAKILNCVEKNLISAGHEIERIDLYRLEINGCLGCLQCKENANEPDCVLIDDTLRIIHSMLNCDLVIFSSPVYNKSFASQMKAFIERCHCLYKISFSDSNHSSFIEGKRYALIVTAGGSFKDNTDQLRTVFKDIVDSHKVYSAGEFYVCNCKNEMQLDMEIELQVKKFSEQLFDRKNKPFALNIQN